MTHVWASKEEEAATKMESSVCWCCLGYKYAVHAHQHTQQRAAENY